jgi:hypothetical protein
VSASGRVDAFGDGGRERTAGLSTAAVRRERGDGERGKIKVGERGEVVA